MAKRHFLKDVYPAAVSVVTKGANRQQFFLRKAGEHEPDEEAVEIAELGGSTILKAADWSAVYCVVAAPGVEEDPGMGADDPAIPDVWMNEAEIRKAAHRFMKNGGLVNRMHESLAPYGQLVENAVALDDFTVNGQTIAKGSWYVALEPTEDGRAKIEDGTFSGVSLQGDGTRVLVKAFDEGKVRRQGGKFATTSGEGKDQGDVAKLRDQVGSLLSDLGYGDNLVGALKAYGEKHPNLGTRRRGGSKKGEHRGGAKRGKPHPGARGKHRGKGTGKTGPPETKGKGGAGKGASGKGGTDDKPTPLHDALLDLGFDGDLKAQLADFRDHLKSSKVSKAHATLAKVEVVTIPGTANVSAADKKRLAPLHEHYSTKAHYITSCARDQMKHGLSRDHAYARCAVLRDTFEGTGWRGKVAKWLGDILDAPAPDGDTLDDDVASPLMKRMAKILGISEDEIAEAELAKANPPTFAERIAQRELDDELPQAFDVLRSCVWQACYPPPDAPDDYDPHALIEQSLDEFKSWVVDLLDRVPLAKLTEQIDEDVADAEAGVEIVKGYMGFDKLVAELKRKNPKWSEERAKRVAAQIGRKKYGAGKFQQAAGSGAKLGKADASNGDGGNVGDVAGEDTKNEGEDKTLDERVTSIEKSLDEMPAKIAKAIKAGDSDGDGDEGKDDDEPTVDSLQKRLAKLEKQLAKAGEGQPSGAQDPSTANGGGTGEDRTKVAKSGASHMGILS